MFEFVKSLTKPNYPTPVKLPSTASETYTEGETLYLSSGALTKASGTTAPTHICAEDYVAPSSGNREIHAYPILEGHIYKTTFSADASSVAVGLKVTIGSSGDTVTATTTNGVATIVKKLGSGASGTEVLVKF